MSSPGRAIIAAAGSGKTYGLALRALDVSPDERVLLTTYTNNGARELQDCLKRLRGYVPANITITPWLSFLLQHGARPYQSRLLSPNEIRGLYLESREQALRKAGWRPRQASPRPYYLNQGKLYRDVLADFVLHCDRTNSGAVFRRLANVFQHLMLDEAQDLSGRDFDVIEEILRSRMQFTLVGDPRQCTYSTTQSQTNRSKARENITTWLQGLERSGLLQLEYESGSRRCIQEICSFADALFPSLRPTLSETDYRDIANKGVRLVKSGDVAAYARTFKPQMLVWDKRSNTHGLSARNFGSVKGLSFDRVLIQPTDPMVKYLQKGLPLVDVARAKFYVAITRARYSVGIVLDRPGDCRIPYWSSKEAQ